MNLQIRTTHASRSTDTSRALAALTCALLLGGLSACGGTSSSTTSSAPATPQAQGAAKEFTHTCTADAQGRWSLSGTLANPTDKDATYTISISIAQSAGSTVTVQKKLTEKVAARASKKVALENFATTKQPKAFTCVVGTTVEHS